MFLETKNIKECYGCLACQNICPVNAIKCGAQGDTYCYPVINTDTCIDCGLCKKVCPYENHKSYKVKQCYVGEVKDREVWKKSSSGGAFFSLVLSIVQMQKYSYNHFYVCGCVFEDFISHHKVIEFTNSDSIRPFMKSKYVLSDCSNIYIQIRDLIKIKTNFVIFSGTPCQVAGLKNFLLVEDCSNLFCIDLLCKGGLSQFVFTKYQAELEEEYGSCLFNYEFRNKEVLENGTIYSRSAKYVLKNGITKKVTHLNDPLLKLFYEDHSHFREACLNCDFSCMNRVGDVSIGDAWNVNHFYSELNPIKGVSVILFNSEKGLQVLSALDKYMQLFDYPISQLKQDNSAVNKRKVSIDRDRRNCFFNNIYNSNLLFSEAVNLYFDGK